MITVVGGTYHEACLEPSWQETYGSGLRACKTLLTLEPSLNLNYHTFLEKELISYLDSYSVIYPGFKYSYQLIKDSLIFYYDYPLTNSRIFPRLDTLNKNENELNVEGENILMYGMIEGTSKVIGNRVVYDPQSPVNPVAFSSTGSTAKELAVVLNWGEARELTQSEDIEIIKEYFFKVEKVAVLVLKQGAKGALVITSKGEEALIPVYKIDKVWSIGSGDVFAAIFAYHWFKGEHPIEATKMASYGTAEYCNLKDYQFSSFESNESIIPLIIKDKPQGQIYLAGPFFTFSQRWLIDQIRRAFLDMGVNVFSPLHDVGFGIPSEVAIKDLKALDQSSMLFAVLDGLDAGTLFETGYASAKGLPTIGYVQNESADSLTMLEGTNCLFEDDLTTAIYRAYWLLAENE